MGNVEFRYCGRMSTEAKAIANEVAGDSETVEEAEAKIDDCLKCKRILPSGPCRTCYNCATLEEICDRGTFVGPSEEDEDD